MQRTEPLGPGEPTFGTTIGVGAPVEQNGYSHSKLGLSAMVMAYKADPATTPFSGKTHVVEIHVHPFRFRVYLTKDEADDLKVVLRYKPSWRVD